VHGVFHAGLLLLHLGLGSRAHLDDGNAAHKLGQALLQLLLVVVAGGGLHLGADLLHAALDGLGGTGALDDGGVLLVDDDLLGAAEVSQREVLELEAQILADGLAAGQGGDVLEHGLAAVAEAGGLHGGHVQGTADLVHHEGGQRLAVHVLGDDQQGAAAVDDLLQQGQEVAHVGDLLLVGENVGVLQLDLHLVGVGHEVGAEVAAIELHALDHVQLGVPALGFLDGDDAVLADLGHGFRDDLADLLVAVGGDGAHLGDGVALDRLLDLVDGLHDGLDGQVDALLDLHGVGAAHDGLDALTVDGAGQHGGGGGAVAGDVGGLGGDLAHQLGAHVLVLVLELDLLGDGDAVLGHERGAELLLDEDVAALGAERDLHRVGELVHAAQDRLAGIFGINDGLGHVCVSLGFRIVSRRWRGSRLRAR